MRTVSPLHEWDEDVATNGVEAAKPMTFYIDRAIAAAYRRGLKDGAMAAMERRFLNYTDAEVDRIVAELEDK
jgi:hypothetical protein